MPCFPHSWGLQQRELELQSRRPSELGATVLQLLELLLLALLWWHLAEALLCFLELPVGLARLAADLEHLLVVLRQHLALQLALQRRLPPAVAVVLKLQLPEDLGLQFAHLVVPQ